LKTAGKHRLLHSPEWGGRAATTKTLAERFGVAPATVSETIKRLTSQGLLAADTYKEIALTVAGERHALAMVWRHRLIETFLVSQLGHSWAEVHDEAESLEHAVSDLMIGRIDDLLDHPSRDPHGDPIPTKSGIVDCPSNEVRLSEAAPGRYTVSRVSDADSDRLVYFRAQGLTPGRPIVVAAPDTHAHTILVSLTDGVQLALAAPTTDAVILVPTLAASHAGHPSPRSLDRDELAISLGCGLLLNGDGDPSLPLCGQGLGAG
jgi:DtxR family Mn-dependent transcriptional regulator